MNVLPEADRAEILQLASEGATTREIAATVGVSRETVSNTIGRVTKERRLLLSIACGMLESIVLESMSNEDSLAHLEHQIIELHATLCFSCPIHPEATQDDFSDDGLGCLLCSDPTRKRHEGMRRHHARRKAEGRPIVPPRPRKDEGH